MRVKTEHGTGNEYILYAPNKNYDFSGRHCDMCAVRFYADCFEVSKSGIKHKGWPERKVWLDAMNGRELSDAYAGGDFTVYNYTDVLYAKRSIRFFIIPLTVALVAFIFGLVAEDMWWLSVIDMPFIPFCGFGFCIRIKIKNGRSIKIPYCYFRHKELAETILNHFDEN